MSAGKDMPGWLPEQFAALAADGVDIFAMGQAYGRRAYPGLPLMDPAVAYSSGFVDGALAALSNVALLTGNASDLQEFFARLYDPDVLPLSSENDRLP